jgi:hypothetical protein
MSTRFSIRVLVFTFATAAMIGCSQKKDATSELEKAANALASADPAPAPQPPPAEPAAQPNAMPAPAASSPPQTPAQEMRSALASYKAGELQDAVTRLQKLRATAVMSPGQRMAMQDAVAAVMSEIYSLAEKGDGRAIQAVKQYEEMQTAPH